MHFNLLYCLVYVIIVICHISHMYTRLIYISDMYTRLIYSHIRDMYETRVVHVNTHDMLLLLLLFVQSQT